MLQIFSLALAIFTFAGSVGVGVFTHFCHDDGIEQSFIIPQTSCCEEKREKIDTCCDHGPEVIQEDCCSEEIDFFQVDFENYEASKFFAFAPLAIIEFQSPIFVANLATFEGEFANYANPPPLRTGRQILIQHQVFRI